MDITDFLRYYQQYFSNVFVNSDEWTGFFCFVFCFWKNIGNMYFNGKTYRIKVISVILFFSFTFLFYFSKPSFNF